jgi:hypothetical protein
MVGSVFSRIDHIPFAIIFGVDHNPVFDLTSIVNRDLHFCIGVDPDIENFPMPGKPGVGPTADIADADWGDGVDDEIGRLFCNHFLP